MAFHGYSGKAEDFEELYDVIGAEYSLYSFDLFFHGCSEIAGLDVNQAVSKTELTSFFRQFIVEFELKSVHVVAYSMGARIAFVLTEQAPELLDKVTLIAPDGLKNSRWYTLATQSETGRLIFNLVTKFPNPIVRLGKILLYLGLLDPRLHKVITKETASRASRQRLYNTWMFFRALSVDSSQVASIIQDHEIRLHIVLGKRDSLIPPKRILEWQYLRENRGAYDVLELAHSMLIQKVFELVAQKWRAQ